METESAPADVSSSSSEGEAAAEPGAGPSVRAASPQLPGAFGALGQNPGALSPGSTSAARTASDGPLSGSSLVSPSLETPLPPGGAGPSPGTSAAGTTLQSPETGGGSQGGLGPAAQGLVGHRLFSCPPRKGRRYKGVRKRKWGRFVCEIRDADGKRIWLGSYDTEELAAHAYDAAARIVQGPFAWLNFPNQESDASILPPEIVEALQKVRYVGQQRRRAQGERQTPLRQAPHGPGAPPVHRAVAPAPEAPLDRVAGAGPGPMGGYMVFPPNADQVMASLSGARGYHQAAVGAGPSAGVPVFSVGSTAPAGPQSESGPHMVVALQALIVAALVARQREQGQVATETRPPDAAPAPSEPQTLNPQDVPTDARGAGPQVGPELQGPSELVPVLGRLRQALDGIQEMCLRAMAGQDGGAQQQQQQHTDQGLHQQWATGTPATPSAGGQWPTAGSLDNRQAVGGDPMLGMERLQGSRTVHAYPARFGIEALDSTMPRAAEPAPGTPQITPPTSDPAQLTEYLMGHMARQLQQRAPGTSNVQGQANVEGSRQDERDAPPADSLWNPEEIEYVMMLPTDNSTLFQHPPHG